MITILIIYLVGVVVNALVMASVYEDMKNEGTLGNVKTTIVALVICGSVLTWLFCICYLIVAIFRPEKGGKK